jgi:thiol-disulfide isomerase/thioredoxin
MGIARRGWKIIAVVLLIGAYVILHHLASQPKSPAIPLKDARARKPFPADFALPDVPGNTLRLIDFRGRVVLVNFWATWCYPCRAEMPSMQALYQEYAPQGFIILAIASDVQGREIVAPFVQAYKLTFPVLLDPHNTVGTTLQIQGIPMSYLLDKQGRIAGMEMGARNWHSPTMRQRIDTLLAESP